MEYIQADAEFDLNASPDDDVEEEIWSQILPPINDGEDDEITLEVEETPILYSSVTSSIANI